ncbi:MAG: glycosyltransferase family 9 protein [bacterium]
MKTLRNTVRSLIDTIIRCESFFHVTKKKDQKTRILILRKDGLGDCILFYPTLRAYRDFYANAEVTLVLPKWFEPLAHLLDEFNFDNVIWFDHNAFSKSFLYRRSFLLNLKKQSYDITLYPVFTREPIAETIMRISGAQEIKVKIPDNIESELDRDIYFAEQITSKKILITFPTIATSHLPEGKDAAETLIKKHNLAKKPFVIIFPGAGAAYRIWPSDRFASIIDHISEQGFMPVICGSPKEKELAKSIVSLVRHPASVVNLSGQTDLPTLAHILKCAAFYFGSDTGILHLATAVGTPAVALIGIGGHRRFFPYGDLQKNRAVYDANYMNEHSHSIGNWDDAQKIQAGTIHPSIQHITTEMAQKEVDYMLHFVNSNTHETHN